MKRLLQMPDRIQAWEASEGPSKTPGPASAPKCTDDFEKKVTAVSSMI